MRTHIVIPKEIVDSVDAVVGKRGRSKFFVDAVEEKLARSRLAELAGRMAGSLAGVDIPGWESGEAAAAWVRASREEDSKRLEALGTGR
jgi:metal-responsive CopG/Arc/MetJ family transcriptional regulator